MYKGFNLTIDKLSDFRINLDQYKEIGEEIYADKKITIEKTLDDYLSPTGELDCSALQQDWFPMVNSHIFISHSHADKALAISLAGWFKEKFNIDCFIDSYVWGYCDDLLRTIDDKYCKNEHENTYNYEKRNYSTSHIHIMLSTALTKMIDKTESIMFLNTDKSTIKTENVITEKTRSPWIYSEITATTYLRTNVPKRKIFKKSANEIYMFESTDKEFKPTYDLDLTQLICMSDIELSKLENIMLNYTANDKATAALDKLYELTKIINTTER